MKKHVCFFCGLNKPVGKVLPMVGPDRGRIVYGCSFHPGVQRENAAYVASTAPSVKPTT